MILPHILGKMQDSRARSQFSAMPITIMKQLKGIDIKICTRKKYKKSLCLHYGRETKLTNTHTHTHTRTLILHAYQIEKMGGEKIRIYFVVQSLDLHPWGKNKNMVSRRM